MPWNVGALQLSQLTEGTAVVDAGVLSPSSAWGHPPTLLTVARGPWPLPPPWHVWTADDSGAFRERPGSGGVCVPTSCVLGRETRTGLS